MRSTCFAESSAGGAAECDPNISEITIPQSLGLGRLGGNAGKYLPHRPARSRRIDAIEDPRVANPLRPDVRRRIIGGPPLIWRPLTRPCMLERRANTPDSGRFSSRWRCRPAARRCCTASPPGRCSGRRCRPRSSAIRRRLFQLPLKNDKLSDAEKPFTAKFERINRTV